jgi:hypothetical protein
MSHVKNIMLQKLLLISAGEGLNWNFGPFFCYKKVNKD